MDLDYPVSLADGQGNTYTAASELDFVKHSLVHAELFFTLPLTVRYNQASLAFHNQSSYFHDKLTKMSRTLAKIAYNADEKKLAAFAKAMGHPVRIQILKILNTQACCYTGDLADSIPLAQSTISQHLKMLKDAGLIQGEIMPPKVKYCLNQENWPVARRLFSELFQLSGPQEGQTLCSSDE